jgi:hypothetical protein
MTLPPQAAAETVAPKRSAAARVIRRGAGGTARSARSAGSSAAQKGHAGSSARTCRSQVGQGTRGEATGAGYPSPRPGSRGIEPALAGAGELLRTG